ncbi:EFR1 family ferrodoxin [Pseudodesulfovibrio sediminis]|uniref:(Fe-S)-binding protein n=1 Tax=Pseudodesulfovibrio sediminis TaxID=2810563 RepID=A0ABN6EWT7_9BACT|nr:EFR1 family ferrodoxin [Pseudodesulfovibrio sediminis]BCS89705.1 (Fe-S)-binding protein [Pseudodesulfovibrio sediminis]
MNINTVKLAYFSPTKTTETILHDIAKGIGPETLDVIDITRSDARQQPLKVAEDELLIVGVPVYMGRVPALVGEWLNALEASNTPAVCVVVYGNREFDDALIELKEWITGQGCVPIAGAAYIGEHSFSDSGLPTAQGRPDQDDRTHAEAFGQAIVKKMHSVSAISQFAPIEVPGNHPYKGKTTLWDVNFIAVSEECGQCGICADVCPVEAIAPEDSSRIDEVKCITCCACIKSCPQNARSIKPGPVNDAQKRLNTNCKAPKKPEWFL